MSPVTATVLIGTNHPYEANNCPDYIAVLREHFRSRWTLMAYGAQQHNVDMTVDRPCQVLDGLFSLIAEHVQPAGAPHLPQSSGKRQPADRPRREYPGMALAFTLYRGSTIHEYLHELKALRQTAISTSELTWQRYRSPMNAEWIIEDEKVPHQNPLMTIRRSLP